MGDIGARASGPPSPFLLLITGPPAAGKTTLARAISRATGLPLVTKDGLKELMYDIQPEDNRESSREIGRRGMKTLFHVIESSLTIGRSIIAEANFDRARASQDIRRIRTRIPFNLHVIELKIDPDTQQRRLEHRLHHEGRHPVHDDHPILEEITTSRTSLFAGEASRKKAPPTH